MVDRGLSDPGRTINRDPSHLAQTILSLARSYGADGLPLDQLGRELPAFTPSDIDSAIGELVARRAVEKRVRYGAVVLFAIDES